jgi:hypothetical protein
MDTICNCHSVQDTLHVTSFTYRWRMQLSGLRSRQADEGKMDGWPGGRTGRRVDRRLARSIHRHKQATYVVTHLKSLSNSRYVQYRSHYLRRLNQQGDLPRGSVYSCCIGSFIAAQSTATLSHRKHASAGTYSGSSGAQGSHKRKRTIHIQ